MKFSDDYRLALRYLKVNSVRVDSTLCLLIGNIATRKADDKNIPQSLSSPGNYFGSVMNGIKKANHEDDPPTHHDSPKKKIFSTLLSRVNDARETRQCGMETEKIRFLRSFFRPIKLFLRRRNDLINDFLLFSRPNHT
jgi:hypothetical protein